jgi:hypothetical protein
MAKQTFTTGQVLTAAQMTSLQDTAMGGGAASTKTVSYVLVAADAGTTIAMNAAGATTITVNTGLFSAGDTVFIQNIGAGATTITAGTATVNTAGSLILPQYDAGILYFTSASAAIFYDYIQVGAASPLTTKGDLYTFSTSDTRLGVGTNGHVLTAASGETTGLKWQAVSSAMTLVSSGSFTAASSFNLGTPFTSSYRNYKVLISLVNTAANNNPGIYCYPRASGSNNSAGGVDTFHCQWDGTPDYLRSKQTNQNYIQIGNFLDDGWVMDMTIYQPNIAAKTFARMKGICSQQGSGTDNGHYDSNFTVQNTTQWDSLGFTLSGDTFTGFYRVYGLAD